MRLIIFDFDGTVYDSESLVYDIVKRFSEKYGFSLESKEEFRDFYDDNFFDACVKRGLSQDRLDEFAEDMERFLQENYDPPVFEFMLPLLRELAEGYHLDIQSSNFASVMGRLLERDGIRGFFNHVVGAGEERSKEARIRLLMGRHGVEEAVFVTDTLGDVREAPDGVKTVGVTWGFHDEHRLKEADYVVSTPEELKRVIGEVYG